jgi:hypothetical protein
MVAIKKRVVDLMRINIMGDEGGRTLLRDEKLSRRWSTDLVVTDTSGNYESCAQERQCQ